MVDPVFLAKEADIGTSKFTKVVPSYSYIETRGSGNAPIPTPLAAQFPSSTQFAFSICLNYDNSLTSLLDCGIGDKRDCPMLICNNLGQQFGDLHTHSRVLYSL